MSTPSAATGSAQQKGTRRAILVTGATGNIGRATIAALMTSPHLHKGSVVLAGVHKGHSLDLDEVCAHSSHGEGSAGRRAQVQGEGETSQLGPGGAKQAVSEHGSHLLLHEIDAANIEELDMSEVAALFIVPPTTENKISEARNYIRAAAKHNVPFVLLLSTIDVEHRGDMLANEMLNLEAELAKSGLEHGIIRSGFYQENIGLLGLVHAQGRHQQGMQGEQQQEAYSAGGIVISLPIGMNSQFSPVAHEDVGQAAAQLLTHPVEYLRDARLVNVVGPTLVSGPDLAKCATEATSLACSFEDCDEETFVRRCVRRGLNDHEAKDIAGMCRVIKQGKLAYEAPTIKTLLSREAKSVSEYFKDLGGADILKQMAREE